MGGAGVFTDLYEMEGAIPRGVADGDLPVVAIAAVVVITAVVAIAVIATVVAFGGLGASPAIAAFGPDSLLATTAFGGHLTQAQTRYAGQDAQHPTARRPVPQRLSQSVESFFVHDLLRSDTT
jgi:hypothetical protein